MGVSDTRRQRRVSIGITRLGGVIHPYIYVRDPEDGTAQRLASAAMVAAAPLVMLYLQGLQWWMERTKEHDEKELVLAGIGPRAFLHAVLERVRGRMRPRYALGDFVAGPGAQQLFVIDDFFANPEQVGELARSSPMEPYEQGWFKTGARVPEELRAVKEQARRRFEEAIGRPVGEAAFHDDMGGQAATWNGALNIKLSENLLALNACSIHNHADLGPDAWAAVVFLNPDSPAAAGTTFWAPRTAPNAWTDPKRTFDAHVRGFVPVVEVPARYNRAVLFPAAALHRGEPGHGCDQHNGRLFQTYFFATTG